MNYRVQYYSDGDYEVIEIPEPVFRGSISDCHSFIRLKKDNFI